MGILLVIWLMFTLVLMLYAEESNEFVNIIVPANDTKHYKINGDDDIGNRIKIILNGPFHSGQHSLKVYVESLKSDGKYEVCSVLILVKYSRLTFLSRKFQIF